MKRISTSLIIKVVNSNHKNKLLHIHMVTKLKRKAITSIGKDVKNLKS